MKSLAAIAACMIVNALASGASAQGRAMTPLEMKGVFGRTVMMQTTGDSARSLNGELLAITTDSVWVLNRKGGVTAIAIGSVSSGWVQRHNYTASKGFKLGMLVGIGSGVLLQLSCNSVDGGDCGGVAPAVIAVSALITGLSTISLSNSSKLRIKSASAEALGPFARFPQGPPPGVNLRDIARRQ